MVPLHYYMVPRFFKHHLVGSKTTWWWETISAMAFPQTSQARRIPGALDRDNSLTFRRSPATDAADSELHKSSSDSQPQTYLRWSGMAWGVRLWGNGGWLFGRTPQKRGGSTGVFQLNMLLLGYYTIYKFNWVKKLS